MLFNSIEYLLFLPIVFLLYWFAFGKSLKAQNLFLLAASYVFYGWWSWQFLILIAITSLLSFASGIYIEKMQTNDKNRGCKIILTANILANLAILFYYKYCNFFIDNLICACHAVGVDPNMTAINVVLPVGISFYTFQALSYSIDVYRGNLRATHDAVSFFAFLSFFPQLVAGPIERATNLLPQIQQKRTFDYATATDGCRQMLWGFFKKVVVADQCALVVNDIFENYDKFGGLNLAYGGILFSIQIYCDFSGYSDIAIGSAKLFGIRLMDNFRFPYFSRDIAEFWRRWHISLTTWFRDYIYIPLGGSRCSKIKVARNTMIIFAVSGLWHGANWTFITWGIYHAILFFPLLFLGLNRKYTNCVTENGWLPSAKEFGQMALTFAVAVIGWIIFRAESLPIACDYLCRMFTDRSFARGHGLDRLNILMVAMLFLVEWAAHRRRFGLDIDTTAGILRSRPLRWSVYLAIAMTCILNSGTQSDFIYFQF